MIEDKETGLKIAESKEEEFYTKQKERSENSIYQCEKTIELENLILAHTKQKLKELESEEKPSA